MTQDEETGKTVGWVPVGDGPEDRWHREAEATAYLPDGTYELVGPKVQGNPEGYTQHDLVPHESRALGFAEAVPVDYEELRAWLSARDVEGVVWHHPDGRMAKIKGKDFGLARSESSSKAEVSS